MKLFLISCTLLFSNFLHAQQLTINEDQVKVNFNFIDQDVDGELSDFQFTGAIDVSNIENANISGSVVTETLDTDNWLRNRHLRSKKYFSTKDHPRLTFKSNMIEATTTGFRVSGIITIKGIANKCTWDFKINGNTLVGTTTINTHDFDIKVYDDRERNKVTITIIAPFTK